MTAEINLPTPPLVLMVKHKEVLFNHIFWRSCLPLFSHLKLTVWHRKFESLVTHYCVYEEKVVCLSWKSDNLHADGMELSLLYFAVLLQNTSEINRMHVQIVWSLSPYSFYGVENSGSCMCWSNIVYKSGSLQTRALGNCFSEMVCVTVLEMLVLKRGNFQIFTNLFTFHEKH
jgi:hypothetical protein